MTKEKRLMKEKVIIKPGLPEDDKSFLKPGLPRQGVKK